MTAFSGVRSSCDIEARNSDLCPDAISSSRAVCTFWIAIAPWAANVVTSSTVRSSNGVAPSRARARSRPAPARRRASARRASCGSRRARSPASSCTPGPRARRGSAPSAARRPTRPTSVPEPASIGTRADVVAVRLRRAERDLHPVGVAVEHVDQARVRAAQPHGLRRARSRTPARARTRSARAPRAPARSRPGARAPPRASRSSSRRSASTRRRLCGPSA